MYHIVRSDEEIDDLSNRAVEEFDRTTSEAAEMCFRTINWLTGATDEDPLA